MAFYQIQSLDDLNQVYADVQVVHVGSDDVGVSNPNRPQQIVLDENQQILLQNDGPQQVVYQTPQQQPQQYQPPAAGAHYTILGEDINQQQQQQQQQHQQQQHQVMMQQQQQHQQVMEQHHQQTHQIQGYQIQPDAQHMQVAEPQIQHLPPQPQQTQQIYYTTDQLVPSSAIVQHSPHTQQTQQQQHKKVYIQQQTQAMQQQYQQQANQTHQMLHQPAATAQQHILQSSQHTQSVQVQHQVSPSAQHQPQTQPPPPPPQQQQIIYRMQPQQPTAQLQQQTQLLGNTHVIVQQPSGQQVLIQQPQQQEIIMRQPMGQRILYNNRVLYSTQHAPTTQQPQQPQQQQQSILQQHATHQQQQQQQHQQQHQQQQQQAHIQLQTSPIHHTQPHLVQARVAQSPQQTTAATSHQSQPLQQNVVYHQIQVQSNQMQKPLQTSGPIATQTAVVQQQQQQQQQTQHQHMQLQQQQNQLMSASALPANASASIATPGATLIRTAVRGNKAGGGRGGNSAMIARMPGIQGVPRAEIRPTFITATGSSGLGGASGVLRTPRPRCSTTANGNPRGRGGRGGRGGATVLSGRGGSIIANPAVPNTLGNSASGSGSQHQQKLLAQGVTSPGIRHVYRTQLNDGTVTSGVAQQHQQAVHIIQAQSSGRALLSTPRFRSPPYNSNPHQQHQQHQQQQQQQQQHQQQQQQQQGQLQGPTTSTATSGNSNGGAGTTFDLDLEDSIQAVMVKKDAQKPPTPAPCSANQVVGTTLTTYYSAAANRDDDDNRIVKTQNGTCMTLAEYKKRSCVSQQIQQTSVQGTTAVKTLHQTPGGAKISLPSVGQTATHTVPVARVAPQKHQIKASGEQQQNLQATATSVATSAPTSGTSVPAASSVHQTSHNNYEIQTHHVLQNRSGQQMAEKDRNSAKMLVILVSGEQRLITFTLPRESCTVQDLLEQVGVPFDSNTTITCVENPGANIDFVVTVGFSGQESASELISRAEQSLQMSRQQESMAMTQNSNVNNSNNTTTNSTTTTSTTTGNTTSQQQQQSSGLNNSNSSSSSSQGHTQGQEESTKDNSSSSAKTTSTTTNKSEDTPQRKLIYGYYAVCQSCGFSGYDHAQCERCKRVFLEPPKKVPVKQVTSSSSSVGGTSSTSLNSSSGNSNIDNCINTNDKKRPVEMFSQRAKGTASLQYNPNTMSSRGRGSMSQSTRGRSRTGRRMVEAETVILTLSSDEEDDENSNKTNANLSGNGSFSGTNINSTIESSSLYKPLSFEGNLPDLDETQIYSEFTRGDVTDISNCACPLNTALSCKIVRLGAYSFEPKEPVIVTVKGIRIVVAPIEGSPGETCCLNIYKEDMVKIIAHFSETSDSVLCFYTLRNCAKYMKSVLKLPDVVTSDDGTHYSANGPCQYRRIVLQLESVSDQAKSVIKSIWDHLDEVSARDAQVLLQRAAENDRRYGNNKKNNESASTTTQLQNNELRPLLIYPPGKGGITINTEDYSCLATDQYLNDIIIDFYLKWLHNNLIPDAQKDRTFMFSTFFYKRLTTLTRHINVDKDVKQTAAQKRHARVQNWTKNVNLFEKDFIIIPINEQSHWFLAIICFPGLKGPVTFDTNMPVELQPIKKSKKKLSLQIGNTTITPLTKRESSNVLAEVCGVDDDSERDEAEGDDSDLASDDSDFDGSNNTQNNNSQNVGAVSTFSSTNITPPQQTQRIKQPIILIFDSLAGASRSRVVATLRDYLSCEHKIKMPDAPLHVFNKDNMPGHCVKVPQQNNFTDCGLYLLQYVEQFFADPIRDYRIPIKQLANWFDTLTVTRKREDISNLLQQLMDERNGPNNKILLPEIPFPTLNGQLVEYNVEFEEDEMDDDEEDENTTGEIDTEISTDDTAKGKSPIKSISTNNSTTSSLVPTQGRKIVVKRRVPISNNTVGETTVPSHTVQGHATPPLTTARTNLSKIRKVE